MTETLYRPEYRDAYYFPFPITTDGPSKARRARDVRVVRLAQQEYLWSVDRPDSSAEFSNEKRWYEAGGRVTSFQRDHLIPRIARMLYGDAADVHERLIAENVSLHYVSEPEYVAGSTIETEGFDDPYEYMDEQAEAFESLRDEFRDAAESLDPDAANRSLDRAKTAAWTVFYYRYASLAAAKARLEAGAARVEELLEDDRTDAAADLAESLLDDLPELQRETERVRERSDELADRLRPGRLDAPPYGNGWIEDLEAFAPTDFEDGLRERLDDARSE